MEHSRKKKVQAVLLALVSVLIWSTHNVAARAIHEIANPVELTFWRWLIAFIIVLPFASRNFKKNFALLKQNIGLYIWIAVLVHVIYNTFFYAAAAFTSANNLSLLTTTSFIWTVIFGAVLKIEKLTPRKALGAIMALSGVLIVVTKQNLGVLINFQFNKGDLILITACFAWGFYALLLKKKPPKMDQVFMFAAVILFGLIMIAPLYYVEHHIAQYPILTIAKFKIFLLVAVFASVISWSLYNNSIHVLGPTNTSMIFFLLPVFSALVAYFWLGEGLHTYHIWGFVFIISGIGISNIRLKRAVTSQPIN